MKLLLAFFIIMMCTWAYLPSFGGVLLFDDIHAIVENDLERYLSVTETLSSPRGIAFFTFALDRLVYGDTVWGFHFTNYCIHLLNGGLVYLATRRALSCSGYSRTRSFLLAVAISSIFLLHPIQTNAVTYVVQRMESLSAMFLLLTLNCWIRWRDSSRVTWLIIAICCCLLGMRTKEVMVSAPLLVFWYDYAFLRTHSLSMRRRDFVAYGLLGVTLVANPAWQPFWNSLFKPEAIAQSTSTAFVVKDVGRWEYMRTQPQVILYYVQQVLWPSDLCLDRGWPVEDEIIGIVVPAVLLSIVFLSTIVATVWQRQLSFLGGLFFLSLAPTSSVIPIQDLYFEHRMYVAAIAVIALVVLLIDRGLKSFESRVELWTSARSVQVAICMFLLTVGTLALVTHARNQTFRSELVMWQDCIDKSPEHARVYYSFAYYVERNRQSELYGLATEYAWKAVELRPAEWQNWNLIGLMLKKNGDREGAIEAFKEAIELDSQSPLPYLNLGNVLIGTNDSEAERLFLTVLKISPNHEDANNNYGTMLARRGRSQDAIPYFRKAIDANPQKWSAYLNLGDALLAFNPDEAVKQYDAVPISEYDRAEAFLNKAVAYIRGRADVASAIACWKECIKRYPDHHAAWVLLANALDKIGDRRQALRILSEARRRFPNEPAVIQAVQELSL